MTVNQPVSSQWIKKGERCDLWFKVPQPCLCLYFSLLSFQISWLWDSQISLEALLFQPCSLLWFLICRSMKKIHRECEAALTAQLKLKPSFCSKSWILNLPSPLPQKKKKKNQKISCLMVSEAQNVLLVLVSSSKGEIRNPSSRAQFLFFSLDSLSWDFVAAGFC